MNHSNVDPIAPCVASTSNPRGVPRCPNDGAQAAASRRFLLRQRGAELQESCKRCVGAQVAQRCPEVNWSILKAEKWWIWMGYTGCKGSCKHGYVVGHVGSPILEGKPLDASAKKACHEYYATETRLYTTVQSFTCNSEWQHAILCTINPSIPCVLLMLVKRTGMNLSKPGIPGIL